MTVNCKICDKSANGKHFGILSCRACAAFFRRAATTRNVYICKKNGKCDISKMEMIFCKKCRLDRCYQLGMSTETFQFNRDLICATESYVARRVFSEIISEQPRYIKYSETPSKNLYVDLKYLMNHAEFLLSQGGARRHVLAPSKLEKLTMAMDFIREPPGAEITEVKKIGKVEKMMYWEQCFLAVAKWLTYFDEFQDLEIDLKLKLLKSMWHIWIQLDKLANTAKQLKNEDDKNILMLSRKSILKYKDAEIDCQWVTKYDPDEIVYYYNIDWNLTNLIEPMMELNPNDTELTFMLAQLCFQHAGKHHQGEILEHTDKFQEVLSNDLHNYYLNDMKMPRYSSRITQLMKMNNMIRKDIWEKRQAMEVAMVFEIFRLEFSDPDVFLDNSC